MRRRFFVEGFKDGSAVLSGDAANHLGRVLRAEPGQLYELSDGECAWLARIEKVNRDAIQFALVERLPVHAAPVELTLLLAIVKFDRFEWAIEKATDLGVNEIVPLLAEARQWEQSRLQLRVISQATICNLDLINSGRGVSGIIPGPLPFSLIPRRRR